MLCFVIMVYCGMSVQTEQATIFGVPLNEFIQMMNENHSLLGYNKGYISEWYLKRQLLEIPEITNLKKPGDQNTAQKGDFTLDYCGHPFSIEVRTLITWINSTEPASKQHQDLDGNTWWTSHFKTRGSHKRNSVFSDGSVLHSYGTLRKSVDIFAVCVQPITGTWEYMFCSSLDLPGNVNNKSLTPLQQHEMLKGNVEVQWPPVAPWTTDLKQVMDNLLKKKNSSIS